MFSIDEAGTTPENFVLENGDANGSGFDVTDMGSEDISLHANKINHNLKLSMLGSGRTMYSME